MNTDINKITSTIIGSAYSVANQLGVGFLEKVYENALRMELISQDLFVEQQKQLNVYYQDEVVGEYFADLFVQKNVVVELKVAKTITELHQAQLMNYLKASQLNLGLLINFGSPRVEIKRMKNGFN